MKILKLIFVFGWAFSLPLLSMSQSNSSNHKVEVNIPEVALLGLIADNNQNVNLEVLGPGEAGNSVDVSNSVSNNNGIWVNYSSIVRSINHKRKIVAKIDGELPAGIKLKVEASEVMGNGKGEKGKTLGEVILSNEPTEIISSIGSCFTGKGINNGHYLKYSLEYDSNNENYAQLKNELASVNIVYTLID